MNYTIITHLSTNKPLPKDLDLLIENRIHDKLKNHGAEVDVKTEIFVEHRVSTDCEKS